MADSFSSKDVEQFSALAIKAGSNEIYDLSDPVTRKLYEAAVKEAKPGTISRDTTSFKEITSRIAEAETNHPGAGIVILHGAYVHMIGGVDALAKDYKDFHRPEMKAMLDNQYPSDNPRNMFLQRLHRDGINLEIGAFGIEDRKSGMIENPMQSMLGRINLVPRMSVSDMETPQTMRAPERIIPPVIALPVNQK